MLVRCWILGCWVCAVSPAFADPPAKAASGLDAPALAKRIEYHLATGWTASKAEPAPLAEDSEFLRRVSLDLTGRIPSVADVRAFLDDGSPDKRQRLVDHLLESPHFVTHFTSVWRSLLVPEATSNFQLRMLLPTFDSWLRKQIAGNVGYDTLVRGLLTTPLVNENRRAMMVNPYGDGSEPTALAFFMAKEVKPENLAAATARLFLGIRLECAQCHDHPQATWKREQFWSYAAFFAGIQRQGQEGFYTPVREFNDRHELPIPGKEQVVQALFLDGKEPQFEYKVPARATLAKWITSGENPYFAKAGVNRFWAHFFGIGLIEPIDDLSKDNQPSHPELLEELAQQFAANQFDIKYLIRAIILSRPYQLSSTLTHASQEDARLFARMAVKGLSAEQLYDSLVQATGYRDQTPINQRTVAGGVRSEFLTKFANPEHRTEAQTSILQALYLMNGHFTAGVTSLERSELLAAVADSPFLDPDQQVETLFLAALSRRPRAEESDRLVKYVQSGGPRKSGRAALGDVYWALLNCPEFILNH